MRTSVFVAALGAAAALAATTVAATGAQATPGSAPGTAELFVVQGLPDRELDVVVDGRTVAEDVATSEVVGPFEVPAGARTLTVSDNGEVVLESSVTSAAGESHDVVVHQSSSASAPPVTTVFDNDLAAVPRGKSRLTVAHTAAVAPADIRVDGEVLFANVANGESLEVVVPAGTYAVDIVPTGQEGPAVLGPLDLQVRGGSVTQVYAVGDPEAETMNVATHVLSTSTSGSAAPDLVDTGSGGQAVGAAPALDARWEWQPVRSLALLR